jgi:hypothetical protein
MNSVPEQTDFSPPYMSWATFEGILDQLKANGIPDLIDRSVLDSKSGTDQTQFLRAAQNFGLIDGDKAPTDRMRALVGAEDRGPLIGEILRENYASVVNLGTGATQQMLEDEFRKFGLEGADTIRKAITFYLSAARQTDIELSQHFKATRPGSGGRRTGRPRKRNSNNNNNNSNDQQNPPPPVNPFAGMHPAIQTLVKALPEFADPADKPEFSTEERKAWFAYAKATFNLIYTRPDGDDGKDDPDEDDDGT